MGVHAPFVAISQGPQTSTGGAAHWPLPWHCPPAMDVQGVGKGRSLTTHCPCPLQVSWAEHSVAAAPQLAPTLALNEAVLRDGSHTWQGLFWFTLPASTQVPLMVQPRQRQASTASLHSSPLAQLRPLAVQTPPWQLSPVLQNKPSSQGLAFGSKPC